MNVVHPEDWSPMFVERLNCGDLEGVLALYAPDARFVTPTGSLVVGRDQIERVIGDLIAARTQMQCQVVRAIAFDDVSILYSDFQITTVDSLGRTVEVQQKAIEVLRRQADGMWALILGDPNGRTARSSTIRALPASDSR